MQITSKLDGVEDCKHCGENTNCIQQKGISGCFCKDADHAKCYDRKNCSLTDPAHKKCKSDCYFWTCQCKPGYLHDSKITSAYICKDINECTIQVGPHANRCGENTECENVGGSYLCACVSSGYVYNEKPPNILYCTDIDECLYKEGSHANECGANTRCFNTVGGYKCPCLSSGFYRVDDFSCKDKDECREKTHNCSSNSQCKNEPGSFRCECKDGYHQKDNFTCLWVEDCKHCGENTNCIQQKGISGCFCKDADHAKCYDRKNCSLTDPAHKECKLDCYFWTCQCKPGYLHDSKITSAYICKAVERCRFCGANSTCVFKMGVRGCACRGANPKECLGRGRCSAIPTPKSCSPACLYRICKCNPGYEFDVGSVLKYDCKEVS
ncbi:hypothetical protein RRG08_057965 [Elysia crispata]|uniref:EGF-like domain-containing protein n=1 Tax=Elysia crispata TaxID=231223 RepID=A0AAE1BDG3_9GAST|nr:hypothetical protein RRG08_057965 [Elysia crispata]